MKTYIKITKYMVGKSIMEQVNDIADAGKMDEDTRLFFSRENSFSAEDIAELFCRFEIEADYDFDSKNIVFKPRAWYLESIAADAKSLCLFKEV